VAVAIPSCNSHITQNWPPLPWVGDASSFSAGAAVADIDHAGVICAHTHTHHVRAEMTACSHGGAGGAGCGGLPPLFAAAAGVAMLALSKTPAHTLSHSCSLPWASACPPRRLQEYSGCVAWVAAHGLCARCPPQPGHPACSQLRACVGEMHISFGFLV